MPRLNVSPTKSNLLLLRRQLALGEEGYDLLEQKRQILLFELRQRLGPAIEAEERTRVACHAAFTSLREALLDVGSAALDRAALVELPRHRVEISEQRLVGVRLPKVTPRTTARRLSSAPGDNWVNADAARARFEALLPELTLLAERATAVLRLARELRRAQRRCNALSKIFIPDRREAVAYISTTLEERERESLAVLKLIRDRTRGGR